MMANTANTAANTAANTFAALGVLRAIKGSFISVQHSAN